MDHKLPNGQWIFFGNVAYEATAEDVQKFLAEAGITVGLDHIRMNNREGYRAKPSRVSSGLPKPSFANWHAGRSFWGLLEVSWRSSHSGKGARAYVVSCRETCVIVVEL